MLKVLSYLLAAMLTFAAISSNAKNNPFLGTWQLVDGEYLDGDKKQVSYKSLGLSSQKVISDKHFAFVSLTNGKFWAAGSGRYQFTDTDYSETPTHASYPLEDGGTYVFKYEINGDIWTNSRWHGEQRVEYEVWQKVK